ncbi:MAG: hypothetical protein M0Q91_16145 [Methanoregula sp.]|jgi:hypothetical protein|nr:hypothetical protein [Methanoregula sp.]
MAKIEIEVPDNILAFMKEFQKWHGDDVDPAKYIQGAIKVSCEGDLDYILAETPKKAKKLVRELHLGSIVMSKHCYPPEDIVVEGAACPK